MDLALAKHVLYPSLKLIREDSKIKKFYLLPGLIWVIFFSILLVYQVIYTYVILLGKSDQALELILQIFKSDYMIEIVIVSAIFMILHILMLPIFEGSLVGYIHQKNKHSNASISDSLGVWLVRFPALFEFNNIFNMFKFFTILNAYLFTLRFIWVQYAVYITSWFLIAFFLSIILGVFTSYGKYCIILENKWAFQAIWGSARLAMVNMKTTLRLTLLIFLMNIKVFINFFIFFIFPFLFALVALYISSQILLIIAFFLLWAVFFWLIIFLWYMTAVLEIFTTAIWYYAYLRAKEKLAEVE